MVSFALSELDMQQILKTLTTLSYVRRKATNILLLYNTHIWDILNDNKRQCDHRCRMAFCKARLASYKTPKRFVFGELPKTSTGKIRKKELRETAVQLAVKDKI